MATEFPIRANVNPAVQDVGKLQEALRKAGKEAGLTEKEIDDIVAATNRAGSKGVQNINSVNKSFDGLTGTIKNMGSALVAAIAVDQLLRLGKAIVNITGEFQKFEAVLTNTLGSQSKARKAMQDIVKFASTTPFSVQQLTDAFVRLANQGFTPTIEQMRRLGDVAASTGKGFDQLTEAIIDAQTGEFERLKEFGIRASKEGDNVTFTFKGVQTQVEFTASAIRDYILSLGDLEGVTGATDAISKTLTGTLSNLDDNLTQLANNMGKYNKGPIGEFFTLLNSGLGTLNEWLAGANLSASDFAEIHLERFRDAFDEAAKAVKETGDFEKLNRLYQDLTTAINESNEEIKGNTDLLELMKASGDADADTLKNLTNSIEITKAELEGYREIRADLDDVVKKALEGQNTEIKLTEEQKKKLEKLRELAAKYRLTLIDIQRELFGELKVDPNSINLFNILFNVDVKLAELGSSTKKMIDDLIDYIDSDEFREVADEMPLIGKSWFEKNKEALQEFRDTAIETTNMAFEAHQDNVQRSIDLLNEQRDRELEIAGDNEEAKDRIRKKYAQREAQLRAKQANNEQQQAIFNLLVNQGPAVARAFRDFPFPIAAGIALLVLAQFGLLLSQTRKQAPPKFLRKGEYDINGPGTETSDSIPAMLSRHESVVPADKSKKFGAILKPLIENDGFDIYDLRRVIDQQLPTSYSPVYYNQARGADNTELLKKINSSLERLERKKVTHINIDRDGLHILEQEGQRWTEYVNNRYSS